MGDTISIAASWSFCHRSAKGALVATAGAQALIRSRRIEWLLSALPRRCRARRRRSLDRTDSSHSTVAVATAPHAPSPALSPVDGNRSSCPVAVIQCGCRENSIPLETSHSLARVAPLRNAHAVLGRGQYSVRVPNLRQMGWVPFVLSRRLLRCLLRFPRWKKVCGEEVHKHSELGREMPARRP